MTNFYPCTRQRGTPNLPGIVLDQYESKRVVISPSWRGQGEDNGLKQDRLQVDEGIGIISQVIAIADEYCTQ